MINQAARESRSPEKQTRRTPLKIELALEMLVEADRRGAYVSALDALQEFGDTAWHSTVAGLRSKGIRFAQQPYNHEHRHGGTARFQLYRISPECRDLAREMLADYQLLSGRGEAA